MDYFETDKAINAKKVAETGASRLGKTVLWTGAAAGDTTLLNPLGYYMHEGGHAVLPGDTDVFIKFMNKYLIP